ncbi:SKP1-like protein 1 isoform X2 [Triticum dicoccoides]|uniref:SKP1-like protein 1 isoform X2 n=1 Tax=Triticum dicoccoides TaxID=85692 RepID=UPI0018909113|nr:SKP1-like protein 1 isoform X2 [Triticum dicoccoides]
MKMVRLRSSDGEEFEVAEETIGAASVMIKGMLEDDVAVDVIPLPNVTGRILSRILDYVNRHFSDPVGVTSSCPGADDTLRRFDDSFVHVDQDTLFDLLLAANFLDMQSLLDLTCKAVADQISGRNLEEIRKKFNIVNDYTKDEEQEVRRENSWAFN